AFSLRMALRGWRRGLVRRQPPRDLAQPQLQLAQHLQDLPDRLLGRQLLPLPPLDQLFRRVMAHSALLALSVVLCPLSVAEHTGQRTTDQGQHGVWDEDASQPRPTRAEGSGIRARYAVPARGPPTQNSGPPRTRRRAAAATHCGTIRGSLDP